MQRDRMHPPANRTGGQRSLRRGPTPSRMARTSVTAIDVSRRRGVRITRTSPMATMTAANSDPEEVEPRDRRHDGSDEHGSDDGATHAATEPAGRMCDEKIGQRGAVKEFSPLVDGGDEPCPARRDQQRTDAIGWPRTPDDEPAADQQPSDGEIGHDHPHIDAGRPGGLGRKP